MSAETNPAPVPQNTDAPPQPPVLSEVKTPASPQPETAKASVKPSTPRRWNLQQQPKKISRGLTVMLIAISTILVLVIGFISAQMAMPGPEAEVPRLDEEFTDPINSYSIRRPLGWRLEDPHDKSNIYLKGPREPGFSPLIVASLDIAPGSLPSYLQLHKGRIELQDKTVKWLSEDLGESIDGCLHTARLEYECTMDVENIGPVKVHALQYIMEDKPRFYRVTCFAAENIFERYLPKFEASVRSFRRQPLPRGLAR